MSSATAAARSSASRLLPPLHLLCLLRVPLRQLLRLLLVLLFHLLRSCWTGVLLRQLLMLRLLLLLEILSFLVLLRDYVLLLLLVFLVELWVPRVGRSGALDGWQLIRMGCDVGARSRSDRRRSVVRGNPLLGGIVGRPCMLSLRGYQRNMSIMTGSLFLRRRALVDPAITAVVADVVRVLVHPCVVNVVNDVGVHSVYRRVVKEMSVLPASAFVAMSEVTVAIGSYPGQRNATGLNLKSSYFFSPLQPPIRPLRLMPIHQVSEEGEFAREFPM